MKVYTIFSKNNFGKIKFTKNRGQFYVREVYWKKK